MKLIELYRGVREPLMLNEHVRLSEISSTINFLLCTFFLQIDMMKYRFCVGYVKGIVKAKSVNYLQNFLVIYSYGPMIMSVNMNINKLSKSVK